MPRKLCAPSELSCQSMQSDSGDGQPATARRAQRDRLASNPSRAPAQRRRHRHGARRKVQTIPSRHRLRCAVAANGKPISTKESRPCGRACGLHLGTGLRSPCLGIGMGPCPRPLRAEWQFCPFPDACGSRAQGLDESHRARSAHVFAFLAFCLVCLLPASSQALPSSFPLTLRRPAV